VTVAVILLLLVLWAVLAIIGFLVKSLLWLAVIGIGFFVATALAGAGMWWGRRK
jgi:hypothetical protein